MAPRAVFDTNVLFSAIGWGGVPGQCLDAAEHGQVQSCTSPYILSELADKLLTKLDRTPTEVERILASLLGFMEVLAVPRRVFGATSDPADDQILDCAVAARADVLVTGDRRHLLPLGRFQSIEIITPAALIARIASPPA